MEINIDEAICALIELFQQQEYVPSVSQFENILTDWGLMIVPIDDPTNFLSPGDEDSD